MVAKFIQKRDRAELITSYPIDGLVEGWYFRRRETSPGAYIVEGADLWGRVVSRHGDDPQALLTQCANDARSMAKE